VRSIWLRHDPANFKQTLKTLEARVANNGTVLTEDQDLPVLRIFTDKGTEYCGRAELHDHRLFLAINDIEHSKTKVISPQTNGICERFQKNILQEFYQVTVWKRVFYVLSIWLSISAYIEISEQNFVGRS
jgi:transposase InsO family protein